MIAPFPGPGDRIAHVAVVLRSDAASNSSSQALFEPKAVRGITRN
jgi:hypothetical protein